MVSAATIYNSALGRALCTILERPQFVVFFRRFQFVLVATTFPTTIDAIIVAIVVRIVGVNPSIAIPAHTIAIFGTPIADASPVIVRMNTIRRALFPAPIAGDSITIGAIFTPYFMVVPPATRPDTSRIIFKV
jgi:hypothetical protein